MWPWANSLTSQGLASLLVKGVVIPTSGVCLKIAKSHTVARSWKDPKELQNGSKASLRPKPRDSKGNCWVPPCQPPHLAFPMYRVTHGCWDINSLDRGGVWGKSNNRGYCYAFWKCSEIRCHCLEWFFGRIMILRFSIGLRNKHRTQERLRSPGF